MNYIKLLPFLFLFCCVNEDNYLVRIGKIWCDRQEECNRADFERAYRDHGDCVDDFLDRWEPIQDCAIEVGCDYRPETVGDCRAELRTVSCEQFDDRDWSNNCDDTYDCTDSQNVQLLLCLARN